MVDLESKETSKEVNGKAEEVEDMEAEETKAEEENKDEEGKDEEVDEDEEEEEEPKLGLLDLPAEVSGKRDRKTTDRLTATETPNKDKVANTYEGEGESLGSIPFIEYKLKNVKPEELIPLYRICFNRPGTNSQRKKDLRLFNGFSFSESEKKSVEQQTNLKKIQIEKVFNAELKKICALFGLKQGTRPEMTEKIFNFLMKPEDMGQKIPKSKNKKGRRKSKKSKSSKKSSTPKRSSQSQEDEESEESDSDGDQSGDEESTQSEDENPKKTPAKKTPAKKAPAKKTPAKKAPAKKTPEKKTPVKKSTKKTPAKKSPLKPSNGVVSDNSDDSDDEPLTKKIKGKPKPPTDDEIETYVKEFLKEADLEEVTMKKVCQRVYDNYPDFDLTHKKDFIKETVKVVISWGDFLGILQYAQYKLMF